MPRQAEYIEVQLTYLWWMGVTADPHKRVHGHIGRNLDGLEFSLWQKNIFLGWKKAFFLDNFLEVYFLFLPVPLNKHDSLPRQVISYTYSYPFTRNGVHSASSGLPPTWRTPLHTSFYFWWWRPNAKVGRVYRGIVDLPLVDGGDSRSAQERAWAYWQKPGWIGDTILGWKKAFFLNNFLDLYFLFLPVPLNKHDSLPRQVISYTHAYPFTRNGVHSASSGLPPPWRSPLHTSFLWWRPNAKVGRVYRAIADLQVQLTYISWMGVTEDPHNRVHRHIGRNLDGLEFSLAKKIKYLGGNNKFFFVCQLFLQALL